MCLELWPSCEARGVACWGPPDMCGHGSVLRRPVSFVGSCSLHWFLCAAMCRTLEFATAAVADRFLAGRVTLGPPLSVLPGPIPSMRAVRMIAGVRCRAPFHLLEWFCRPTRAGRLSRVVVWRWPFRG